MGTWESFLHVAFPPASSDVQLRAGAGSVEQDVAGRQVTAWQVPFFLLLGRCPPQVPIGPVYMGSPS